MLEKASPDIASARKCIREQTRRTAQLVRDGHDTAQRGTSGC